MATAWTKKQHAKFSRTMRLKRKEREAKANGKAVSFPLNAIPDRMPSIRTSHGRAMQDTRDMGLDIAAGSQLTLTLGGVKLTVRATH